MKMTNAWLRSLPDERLREIQISTGLALDRTSSATGRQKGSRLTFQRRYWRILNELDARRARKGSA